MKIVVVFIFATLTQLFAVQTINFGVFAYMGYEKTKQQYDPLVNYLNKNLNMNIKLHILTHQEMVTKVSEGTLDIITTNPTNFLLFRQRYNLSGALATLIVEHQGKPVSDFAGVIVVPTKSQITKLQDLQGKIIATSAMTRMGGFRAQAYELHQKGIDILKNRKNIIQTDGAHQEVVLKMLMDENIDVAFVRSGTLESMFLEGTITPEDVKVIHPIVHPRYPFITSTALYPEWPIFAMPHMDDGEIKKIIAALYTLKNDSSFAKESGIFGYTIPADYLQSEELTRALRLPPFEDLGKIKLEDLLQQYGIFILLFFVMMVVIVAMYIKTHRHRKKIDSLLQNIGDGVYGVDKNGICIWTNQKALSLIGFRQEEVLGKHQHELIHHTKASGEHYPNHECPIAKTILDGQTRQGEEHFITKEGKFFPVSYTSAPTQDGAIVVFRDISKAKEIELQLKKSLDDLKENEQLLSGFVQNTSALIAIKDLDGRYLFANDAWLATVGLGKSDVLGKSDHEIFEKDVAKQFVAHDLEAVEHDTIVESNEFFDDASGRRYFIATKFPYKDAQNKIKGICVVITEITKIKKSQEQIDINEKRYSSLLDSMQELIFIKDSKLRYVVTNKALEDFFGASKNDIYLKTDIELMGEEKGKACHLSDQAVLEKKSLVVSEEAIDDKIYETHKFPVQLGGDEFGVGCFIADITQKKAAREQIEQLNENLEQKVDEQTEKLRLQFEELSKKDKMLQEQAKLAAMGEMMSAIAHQWRQPLNALSINIQNLDDDYEDGLIDEVFIESFIHKQTQMINFMSKTIDDFRYFFKTDKQKSFFSVLDMVKSVEGLVNAQLESHQIKLVIEGDDFEIRGYESEMKQVFLNIISNSKDAMIDKGVSGAIVVKLDAKSKSVSVCDCGGGVDEKVIKRIFEPYFTTKEQGKGTGIGLHMSRIIVVEHMGGDIVATNGEKGLCMQIKFGGKDE